MPSPKEALPYVPRHVLVTGATRGIGRAITEAFIGRGDIVTGFYARSDDIANELAQTYPGQFFPLRCDLADPGQIVAAYHEVACVGHQPTVLINNAGVKNRNNFLDSIDSGFDETFSINLRAPWLLCKLVLPFMIANGGGSIINISSQAVPNHTPTSIEYGMSKAALESMTLALAKGYACNNVRVNAIAPGRTNTDLTGYATNIAKAEKARSGMPLGRIIEPHEIAQLAVFLADITMHNMTGVILPYDGGEVIRS